MDDRFPIVVTGAASGMGRATTDVLSKTGHAVLGVDLAGAEVLGDLGTEEGRQAIVGELQSRAPEGVAGLITFAGLAGYGNASAALVRVNYFGTVRLATALRPALVRSGRGRVVAIGSNASLVRPDIPADVVAACLADDEERACAVAADLDSPAVYAATKLAVVRWVRRNAPTADWIGAGVSMNAVVPGHVATPMTRKLKEDPVGAAALEQEVRPIGRPGRPEEIAALASFLVGPMAGFLVGSLVVADGGADAALNADVASTRIVKAHG